MTKLLLAVLPLLLCGCDITINSRTGAPIHESKSVDLGKFEMARVELHIGAGELHVTGGSPKLVEADFDYNVPSWKPVIESNSASFRADVKIHQTVVGGPGGNGENKWNVRVNNDLPMDFVTHLGAGEADMNLGSVNLRSLEIHMGVGKLDLDLRGAPKHDYDVQVHGGVGEAVVRVPRSAGISAQASGGIGDIQVDGLERRNGRWVNEGSSSAPARIRLEIHGGVGNIRLVAE
jgi:hypothetical protein